MENGFNKKSWYTVIAHVQEQVREYTKQSQGRKYEITVIEPLHLKAAIALALEDRSDWGESDKAFVQALWEKMNDYIQQNPEGFYTPLHFVFTGVDMTVSEANQERQRVASLYEAVELGEQHLASRIQATVAQLFLQVWPAIEHGPSLRLNGYE
jgi:DNA-binding GntR family transcriptional regulator